MILGLAGWSGSGKTTLLCAILPHLRAAGLSVSTIKHAHHALQLDQPGKDSFRHRAAGASEVLLAGGEGWALFSETPHGTPDLAALAGRLAPTDLVLVEGFRFHQHPRIEVFREALGKPALWPDSPGIVAVATDSLATVSAAGYPGPIFSLDNSKDIACWIMAFMAACRAQA